MDRNADDLEALWKRALPPEGPCPSAEVVARGAAGELGPEERFSFANHVASCETCAALIRLYPDTKAWARDAAGRGGPWSAVWRRPGRGRWLLAAAAALALAAGIAVVRGLRPAELPSYRDGAAGEIRSLLEPDRPLPRAAFRLRWTPGPPGSRYTILVARQNLARIARAQGLTAPDYLVEEPLLRDFPAGTRIVWAVEASLPGKPPVRSPVFVTAVE